MHLRNHKSDFRRSHCRSRAILFGGIVLFSMWAQADVATEFLIAPQGVKVDQAWYPFGNERVDEARNEWLRTIEKSGVECHATTRFAVRKNDRIVLVETGRRKLSRSFGILCFTTTDVSKFSAPFEFSHAVLKLGPTPTLEEISSQHDTQRPEVKINELKNPDILRTNKKIAQYLRQALERESPLVTRTTTPVQVREIPAEEMAQLPPLKAHSAD
jgi:hypothetical protein